MDQVNKFVDRLIDDFSRAEAENVILRTRVKVLEEMLGIATNAIEEHLDQTEQEAIGTIKYGEAAN